jgi:hypothetical protein
MNRRQLLLAAISTAAVSSTSCNPPAMCDFCSRLRDVTILPWRARLILCACPAHLTRAEQILNVFTLMVQDDSEPVKPMGPGPVPIAPDPDGPMRLRQDNPTT